jgi:hypothetical protein
MKARLTTDPPRTAAPSTALRTWLRGRGSTHFAAATKHAVALVVSALQEIFDESAYTRFLERRKMVPSRASYSAFCHEYESTKSRKPRCC